MDLSTAGKRRRLTLFDTMRVRNGGSNESHITPFNTPAVDIDAGSDTEDENDEETAQYYLNKMVDDTDRPKETVFGAGVEVWRSYGGTVYADLTDDVKRKIREEELWGQEAMEKVEGGLKRRMKMEEEAKKEKEEEVRKEAETRKQKEDEEKKKEESIEKKKTLLPTPNPPTSTTPKPYPDRDPTATQFHRSSSGIDPLGAHNRPIKPLPKRRLPSTSTLPVHHLPITTITGLPTPSSSPPLPPIPQPHKVLIGAQTLHPHPPRAHGPIGANKSTRDPLNPPILPIPRGGVLESRRRVVSGSFGSFEGGVSRFDERGYRFLPRGGDEKKEGDEEKKKEEGDEKVDVFKGRPWLRR